jgi:hypothetical protein
VPQLSVVEQAKQGRLGSARLPLLPPQHAPPQQQHPPEQGGQWEQHGAERTSQTLVPLQPGGRLPSLGPQQRPPSATKLLRPLSAAPAAASTPGPAAPAPSLLAANRPPSAKKLRPLSGGAHASPAEHRTALWQQLLGQMQQQPESVEFVYLRHAEPAARDFDPFDLQVGCSAVGLSSMAQQA